MRNENRTTRSPFDRWRLALLPLVILLSGAFAVEVEAATRPAPTRGPVVMPPVDQPAPIHLEKAAERPVGELGPAPIPQPQDDIGNKPFAPRSAAERTGAVTAAPTISIGVVPTLPVRAGLLITWTATATGGVAPYQYLFARYSFATSAWTVVQPYGNSNVFTWTPTQSEVGKYMLQVWVLNSGSTATFDAYKTTAAFDILSSLPTITSVTANTTFPKLYGTAITWTANATGGIAPLQYRFIRYSYATSAWTIVRDYAASNTFTWTPSLSEIGKYFFQVWVLNAGSTAFYDAYASTAAFDISGPPPTITSFTSSPVSPSPAGVAMTWTAVATGGVAPLQYLFALYDAQAGTWSVPQNYGTSNTFTWIPTALQAGQYQIQVWVRNAGSGNTYDAFKGVPFTIGPLQPLAVSGFPVLPGLPRPVGTTIIWQANTTGGMAPLQYAFYRYSAATGTWSLAQNWSTNKLFTWTPAPAEAGNYQLQVWVRNAGTASGFDAYANIGPFAITPPTSDIVRFLEQATFGPTNADIERVRLMGMSAWIDDQFLTAPTGYPPFAPVTDNPAAACTGNCQRDNYSIYPLQRQFFLNALYGPDQLRQRVAWALHSLVVTSGLDLPLPSWYQPYLDIIYRNAFGNYRQLLYEMTLNPGMGVYLDTSSSTKNSPNENYAREILQLFSTGTDLLNIDGTPVTLSNGTIVPVYDQFTVTEFARVFTGWRLAAPIGSGITNYRDPMVAVLANHDLGQKVLLGGFTLPSGQTPDKDLNDALDNIMSAQSAAPYISRHLIKYLVTSNPSPAYVQRIATLFNNNGSGIRGDLKTVVKAILLDTEARQVTPASPAFGHLKEPVLLMTHLLRAMNVRSANGLTASDGFLAPTLSPMGQDALRPPTVFSYYPADYQAPGTTIRGPEFGLFQSTTALKRANFVNTMVFSNIPATAATGNAPNGTSIDLTLLTGLAANPDMLVKELDRLLMHDTMSAEMKTTLLWAMNAIPASNLLLKAQTALYLLATSSQYQVER